MNQHDLNFSFKARYYKLGEINEHTREVWFVIHGYGQLAQFFIRKFKSLESKGICVIAPEGLSRFYLSELQNGGFHGNERVGATWMTRENRLTDIENYITYLDAVYAKENPASIKVTVLGFSQGAATASRWVMNHRINFERLILWAGAFPPDMDFEKGREVLEHKEIIEVYGKSDPYVNPERMAELHALNTKLNIIPKMITFEGKHEIDEATLLGFV